LGLLEYFFREWKMFDPNVAEKILIALLRDPAMAEITAIASIVVSAISMKKPNLRPHISRLALKKIG
jgi:hypothetical protein